MPSSHQVDTQARFPYASLVLWDMGTTYGTCSGSLVAPGFVLTAAHVRAGVGAGGRDGHAGAGSGSPAAHQ